MNPWDRRPDETPQAYETFRVYLELGADRSLVKASRQRYGKKSATAPGHVTKWSSCHDWVDRAAAWDAHEAAERAKDREQIRARARDHLAEHALRLAERLVDIALGDDEADLTQLKAVVEALNRAGVSAPLKVEVDHEHRHRIELRDELKKLDEMDAEDAVKAYRETLH